jgi:hypothetical protein
MSGRADKLANGFGVLAPRASVDILPHSAGPQPAWGTNRVPVNPVATVNRTSSGDKIPVSRRVLISDASKASAVMDVWNC